MKTLVTQFPVSGIFYFSPQTVVTWFSTFHFIWLPDRSIIQIKLLKSPILTKEVKFVTVAYCTFLNHRRPMLIHYVVVFPVCQDTVFDEIPAKIELWLPAIDHLVR